MKSLRDINKALHQCNKVLYIYTVLAVAKLVSASHHVYHSGYATYHGSASYDQSGAYSTSKQGYLAENGAQFEKSTDSDYYLAPEYLEKLKTMFRFVDLRNTALGGIFEHNLAPSHIDIAKDLSIYEIEDMLEQHFVNSMENNLDLFRNNPVAEKSRRFLTSPKDKKNRKARKKKESQFDDQTSGYEGCRRDYAALAEPITNGIIERVARSVLTNYYADAKNQSQFCALSCALLCALDADLIPDRPELCIRGCEGVCNTIDVSDNTTKDDVIDNLIDVFLPHISPQPWARKMVDCLAKIPSGISDGQLMWTGAWDLCNDMETIHNNYNWSFLNISITEQRQFNAKGCRIPFQPRVLQNFSISLYGYIGVCVPDTCSPDDMETYLYQDNIFFRLLLGTILDFYMFTDEVYCGHDNDLSSDPAMQCCLGISFSLLFLVLIAAIYDAFVRPYFITKDLITSDQFIDMGEITPKSADHASGDSLNDTPSGSRPTLQHSVSDSSAIDQSVPSRPTLHHMSSVNSTMELLEDSTYENIAATQKPTILDRLEVLFVGFSPYSNIKRVFKIDRPEGYLATVDFIRFLSYGWVTFGHTWLYGPILNELWETANLRSSLAYYPRQFAFQAVLNFHYAGDTFFLISGLLTAYLWLRKYSSKEEKITVWSVLYFYAHRYWTLMPAMMFVLMIYTVSYTYLVNGPLTPYDVTDADHCRDYWWKCLLLIQNFAGLNNVCLAWTWYVACVFQLHLMAPIILIPLVLKPRIGYVITAVLYVIHIIVTSIIASKAFDAETFVERTDIFFTEYLVTPWCRAGPYLIGIPLAVILHSTQLQLHIPSWQKLIGWLVALVCLIFPVYGTYTQVREGGDLWSKAEQVMYDTFGRSAWALGVAWVILLCSTNNGGYLGDWLNHRMHQPLARLTYPSFLVQPLLSFFHVFSQRYVLYITWMKMVHMALANVLVSFFVGLFVVGFLAHYPIAIGLQRVLLVSSKMDCIRAGMYKDPYETMKEKRNQ